jgi:hypothetical protein
MLHCFSGVGNDVQRHLMECSIGFQPVSELNLALNTYKPCAMVFGRFGPRIGTSAALTSSEKEAASKHGCDYANEVSAESSGNGVPRLSDADRAEIDRHHVKCCFGTAVNCGGHVTQNVVRSQLFHQVGQDGG